jgi:integrase
MRPKASHLYKSRHGIWYFRWIVPADYRLRHPALPKEIKKSTKTTDTRAARAVARKLHFSFLLRYAIGTNMSSPLDGIRFSGWTLKRDATTNRITELSVGADDTPEMLARLDRVLDIEAAQVSAPPLIAQGVSAAHNSIQQPVLIGEAIERYGRFQIQTEAWSENTFKHTHEPSLRLFKELVGRLMEVTTEDGAVTTNVDRPFGEVTRQVLESFIEEFWLFPSQQGKRGEGRLARDVLRTGGPQQSRANVFKRLAHIRQFLVFCCDKNYLQREVLRELDLVLAKDTARAREKAALASAGAGGVIADGYVAFSNDDIQALFGPVFVAHARDNPARYWIPLLGLFAGLRVGEASQLRPTDFETVDGVDCLRVTGDAVGQSPSADAQRVKTLASLRLIPLHPKLKELGLMGYVQQRRETGEAWMWDGLLWTSKSGFGKYPSRDFKKLAEKAGIYQPRRKVFHSFRSTIAQALERHGLEGELIDRFLGHGVKTTRATSYSRTDNGAAFPIKRVLEILSEIDFLLAPEQAVSTNSET